MTLPFFRSNLIWRNAENTESSQKLNIILTFVMKTFFSTDWNFMIFTLFVSQISQSVKGLACIVIIISLLLAKPTKKSLSQCKAHRAEGPLKSDCHAESPSHSITDTWVTRTKSLKSFLRKSSLLISQSWRSQRMWLSCRYMIMIIYKICIKLNVEATKKQKLPSKMTEANIKQKVPSRVTVMEKPKPLNFWYIQVSRTINWK